ncbi:MAG: molybdopterin molybdotransferase MoeA [Verrucomicrobiota bacterium]
MDQLASPAEADRLLRATLDPLPTENVAFQAGLHRTLRQSLLADRPFPPFDRIMMDGIACRHRDLPSSLTIQGLHPAGAPEPDALKPKHCWQVMTGAVLPPGCDTVIPVEELLLTETTATPKINYRPSSGQFIHQKGSDCEAGTILLEKGTRLNPAHLSLAATIGTIEISVTKQPKISIITTGDELIPASANPLPHQIRQSNGDLLYAALQTHSQRIHLQHLPDSPAVLQPAIETAITYSSLVLITGGISKGTRDFIRPLLETLIGPPTFHGLSQRPGKPLAYWEPTDTSPPILALPGNPNSTLTTFHRYVRPTLDLLAGTPTYEPVALPLAEPLSPHPKLTLFLPATLKPEGTLQVDPPQNSGDIPAFLHATGIIEVPPGNQTVTSAVYRTI